MFEDVKEKLKTLGISPIFFVGSGLSKRYIDSPDWYGLLKESIDGTNISFKKYEQKYTSKDRSTNEDIIDFEGLAEELEEQYFDSLSDEQIEDGKSKPYYYRKRIAEVISSYLDKNKDELHKNNEIIELKKTYPSAIITTNYDEMLEEIFGDEYTVHIGQTSLLTNVLDGVGEIYKIHGCVTKCDSIVITKSDYDVYSEKELYLNSKILTLFLEYPIVFLGYSVSDRNVKSILSTIFNTLPHNKVEELKNRMWFITRPKDGKDKAVQKRINLENGEYIDINSYELNHYDDFYKVVSDISNKKLPIRFLKYLKNNTYKLVSSQEYNPKLLRANISDIEKIKDFNEGNNFVGLTFSTHERKVLSSPSEIIGAFINNDDSYDEMSILAAANRVHYNTQIIPIYKFIANLNIEDILTEVESRFGTDSKIYKRISDDNINYCVSIGNKKEDIQFNGSINDEEVEEYLKQYMIDNGYREYQKEVIKRYFMLYLLNNRLSELTENIDYINKNKINITKAATHLSDEYIKANSEKIISLISVLYNQNDTGECRKLIALVDRAIYRNTISKLHEVIV
ncbi:SIR2 family protein [Intestinibacter sp.]